MIAPTLAARYKDVDPAELGARIRAARIAAKLTQPGLAPPEMSVAYLSRVESGQRRPSLEKLEALARRCGVTIEWFLNAKFDGEERESADDVRLRVLAVLPAECYVTRSSDIRCSDLAGGTFANGAKWTSELSCLPCQIRAAIA